ncbi:MAG: hypothetical protein M0R74_16800 [Dehalococcoidia bacterium]|nr:hypothetical protein [Dehalococcoidia bacterium]
MTFVSRLTLFGLVAMVCAAGAAAAVAWRQVNAEDPVLTTRAILPLVARDYEEDPLPPADPSYCELPSGPASPPPEALMGNLTIGGAPAPAGTVVQVLFDGKAGPAARTLAAGGYRVLFGIGGTSCSNQPGAAISVQVSGQTFATGLVVGPGPIVFDIAVP